jgi:hypothetical protein
VLAREILKLGYVKGGLAGVQASRMIDVRNEHLGARRGASDPSKPEIEIPVVRVAETLVEAANAL